MQDRISKYPGRIKLTPVEGQEGYYDMERADEPTQTGTPLNKNSLLKDSTAQMLNLYQSNPTVNDALWATQKHAETVQDMMFGDLVSLRLEPIAYGGEKYSICTDVSSKHDSTDLSEWVELEGSIVVDSEHGHAYPMCNICKHASGTLGTSAYNYIRKELQIVDIDAYGWWDSPDMETPVSSGQVLWELNSSNDTDSLIVGGVKAWSNDGRAVVYQRKNSNNNYVQGWIVYFGQWSAKAIELSKTNAQGNQQYTLGAVWGTTRTAVLYEGHISASLNTYNYINVMDMDGNDTGQIDLTSGTPNSDGYVIVAVTGDEVWMIHNKAGWVTLEVVDLVALTVETVEILDITDENPTTVYIYPLYQNERYAYFAFGYTANYTTHKMLSRMGRIDLINYIWNLDDYSFTDKIYKGYAKNSFPACYYMGKLTGEYNYAVFKDWKQSNAGYNDRLYLLRISLAGTYAVSELMPMHDDETRPYYLTLSHKATNWEQKFNLPGLTSCIWHKGLLIDIINGTYTTTELTNGKMAYNSTFGGYRHYRSIADADKIVFIGDIAAYNFFGWGYTNQWYSQSNGKTYNVYHPAGQEIEYSVYKYRDS